MRPITAALLTLPLLLAAPSLANSYSLEVVAVNGDPFPLGGTFGFCYGWRESLNDDGEVAFRTSVGVKEYLLVREADGGMSVRVAGGEIAPGTGEARYDRFPFFALNDAGELAFSSLMGSGFSPPSGVFRESGGTISPVAIDGDPAPDLAPAVYYLGTISFELPRPSIAENGDVAFRARLDTTPDRGIFVDSAGTDSKLVALGDTVEGTGGATLDLLQVRAPFLSDLGNVTFRGRLASDVFGIFRAGAGGVSDLVLDGDPSPAGGNFGIVRSAVVNASGRAAFWADSAIFATSGAAATLLVSTGDPAPGGTHSIQGGMAINDLGDVVFNSTVAGTLGLYGYRASDGTISRVVQVGDPFPGTNGLTIQGIDEQFSINRRRQVAFTARWSSTPLALVGVVLATPQSSVPALGLGGGGALVGVLAVAGGLAAARHRRHS